MIYINIKDENWRETLLQNLKFNGLEPTSSKNQTHKFNYLGKTFTLYLQREFIYSCPNYFLHRFINTLNTKTKLIEFDVESFKKRVELLSENSKARREIKNILGIQNMFIEAELLNLLENVHKSYKFISSDNNLDKNKTISLRFSMFDQELTLNFWTMLPYKKFKDKDIKTLNWTLYDNERRDIKETNFNGFIDLFKKMIIEYEQKKQEEKIINKQNENLQKDISELQKKICELKFELKKLENEKNGKNYQIQKNETIIKKWFATSLKTA